MANKTIRGIVIEIDGNTDGLAKSLKDVNNRISEVNGALSKVNKALKLDPTNVEALKQKQDLLAQSIEATKRKLELEQEAADKAKKALELGTISQGEYDNLQAEVQLTTSRLASLEKEAAETGDKLDALGADAKDAAADVDDVGDKAKKSGDAAKDAGEGYEKFGNAAKIAGEMAAAAMAAAIAAIGAATAALAECTLGAAEYADEMQTLSSITGLSTDTLQEFSYASELLDVDVNTIAGSLKKCVKSMADAKDGTGAAADAYAALGVSVTDANGNLRDSEEVFFDVVDALGNIENDAERDSIAMTLLGKSATDLNPLIEAGTDTFKQYADEAKDAGAVLSSDVLDDFAEFDDTMQRLDGGANAAKNALGTILLPVLGNLAGEGVDLLADFTNGVLDAEGDMGKISDLIGELIPQALDAVLGQLPAVLELGGSIVSALGTGLLNNLDLILTTAGDILLTLVGGILDALPEVVSVALDVVMALVETLLSAENVALITQAALDIVITLINGISNNISMIISTAITVINTIQTTLVNNAPELLSAALELVLALVFGILDNLDEVIEAAVTLVATIVSTIVTNAPELIPEAIAAVMSAFGELGDGLAKDALTWGADLIANLIDGVMDAIPDLKGTVDYVAGLVDDYLGFSVPEKGPLADFDKSGGDMIDLFAASMRKQMPILQSAVNTMGNTIAGGTDAPNYTAQLDRISGQLAGGGSVQVVTPVYIGGELIANEINTIQAQQTYISGGRA